VISRGEIYLVNWEAGRGNEQAGIRPALVIQNDIGNKYSSTTIVAAISTKTGNKYPFQVTVEPQDSGLNELSIVKLDQILTVSKERLVKKAGKLAEQKMAEVDKAIHLSLGLQK